MSETGPRALPAAVRWEMPPVSGQRPGEGDFVLPVGTVTLLLADVEGSTRLWEGDADAMTTAMTRLDRVVDEAIGCHGGVRPVEQGEGDSFVAAFARASDAVGAALALQRSDVAPISLRLGLHTGEVQLRDEGNYIGSAVNRCARVRDLAHGGQTVLSQPVRDLVVDHLPPDTWLIDLGTHRLRDLSRGEHVYQLAHADLQVEFPVLRSLDTYPNNLPVQMTSFIGRIAELSQVTALLAEARLVTLTGSGGCGKTRLALHAAAAALTDYPDGVWQVDLASLADPALVPSAIAKTLGLHDVPTRSTLDVIVGYLEARRVLLVIDNCEHLIDSSAETIEGLLHECPSLSVLATSREPLSTNGEVAWRVPSLTLPDDAPAPIGAVTTSEAVELFVERASRARPGFEMTATNSAAVVDICRRLDGIPLAIELAAARVRAFTPEQISQRLHDRFRLLTGGARTAVPRQHTLRASVDWSHQLLTELEQVLFRRLAVFAGSFDLAAAEAVGAGDPLESHQVLDQLSLLVDKSLVIAIEARGEFRYRLLETVRQYAQERLSESEEADTVRQRHRNWFLELAEQALLKSFSEERQPWVDRQAGELDNLRVAFHWSRESGDQVAALRIAAALQPVWMFRGYQTEGRQWLELTLPYRLEADPWTQVMALGASGLLESHCLALIGLERSDEAVQIARQVGAPGLLTWALSFAAYSNMHADPRRAVVFAEEAVELARQGPQPRTIAASLAALGTAAMSAGDLRSARAALEERRRLMPAADEDNIHPTSTLSATLFYFGELRESRRLGHQSVIDATRAGDHHALTVALNSESMAAGRLGEGETARDIAERSVALACEIGHPGAEAMAYVVLGRADMAAGDPTAAQGAFGRARDLFERIGHVGEPLLAQLAEADLAAGDLVSSARYAREARERDAKTGRDDQHPGVSLVLSRLALLDGSSDAAEDLAHQALRRQHAADMKGEIPDTLEWLASLAVQHESYVEGARLYGAADALRRETGAARYRVYDEWYESSVGSLRDAIGIDALEQARAEGAALSLDDALAYAARGRGERKRPATGWTSLTPAEQNVARLVAEGLDNRQIAERLFVSGRTVQSHLTQIYRKLGVPTRVALANEASRQR